MSEPIRKYKTNPLPIFQNEREINFDEREEKIVDQLYKEVHANYRHLADIRFKLLGFVPAVSVIAWAQIIDKLPPENFFFTISGVIIAFLGFRITYGIRIYDRRNDELYDDLISRGRKIEEGMNIHTGIFMGRKDSNHKDKFKKPINHGRGTSLIYSSVFWGWGLLFFWYLGNFGVLLEQFF